MSGFTPHFFSSGMVPSLRLPLRIAVAVELFWLADLMQPKDSCAIGTNSFNAKKVIDYVEYLTVSNPHFLTIPIPDVPLMDLPKGFGEVHAFVSDLLGSDILYQLTFVGQVDFPI